MSFFFLPAEHKPENQMTAAKDEVTVKQEDAPPSKSVPPGESKGELADMCENTAAQNNAPQ